MDPIRSVNVCPHEHPLINLDQLLGLHTGKLPKSWGQKPADVIRFTRWKTTALSNSYSGPAKLREEVTILMITQPWLFGFESSTWPNYKTSWGTEHWSSLHLLHEVYCLLRRERWEPVKLRLKIMSLKATRPSKKWARRWQYRAMWCNDYAGCNLWLHDTSLGSVSSRALSVLVSLVITRVTCPVPDLIRISRATWSKDNWSLAICARDSKAFARTGSLHMRPNGKENN